MNTFGNRLAACRKAKNLSQKELADLFVTSPTTIGKYERDEMTPGIDAVIKLAKLLDTTVGYLVGETDLLNWSDDPNLLKRFQAIADLSESERNYIFNLIDMCLRDFNAQKVYVR
ncbi:MAG: helix-turn-helix transcriptional regulator [Chitinophagaceae bacterium]|nr:helix-turn-helix transcriptional regulator [Chitinophagaceae bacterium]